MSSRHFKQSQRMLCLRKPMSICNVHALNNMYSDTNLLFLFFSSIVISLILSKYLVEDKNRILGVLVKPIKAYADELH